MIRGLWGRVKFNGAQWWGRVAAIGETIGLPACVNARLPVVSITASLPVAAITAQCPAFAITATVPIASITGRCPVYSTITASVEC